MNKRILVTGGAAFPGLAPGASGGHNVVCVDDYVSDRFRTCSIAATATGSS